MKPSYGIACAVLMTWEGAAQEATSTNRVTEAAGAVEPVAVSVPVPVVRAPAGAAMEEAVGGGSLGGFQAVERGVEAGVGAVGVEREGTASGLGPGLGGQMRWSANGVGLREPMVTNVRTNRGVETKGVLPRVTRSERRGFGGFLAGFANLFNPLAPTSKGVETRGEHWYDGGVQGAPLPRGFRDERAHEPQTSVISVDFGRGRGEEPEAKPATAPGQP